MSMKPITHSSDQVTDYAKALGKAATLAALRTVLESYRTIAADALDDAPKDEKEFEEFRKGLAKERRGEFAGEEWAERFGAVMMPEVMFRVSLVSNKFHAPWGMCFLRLKEAGHLAVNDVGVAVWLKKDAA